MQEDDRRYGDTGLDKVVDGVGRLDDEINELNDTIQGIKGERSAPVRKDDEDEKPLRRRRRDGLGPHSVRSSWRRSRASMSSTACVQF